MVRDFCFVNLEFNTIKCNTVINLDIKTVGIFFIALINVMNILTRIID
ncbi:MAG: hypothetical protein ACREVX_16910 [Clostridium sp.]